MVSGNNLKTTIYIVNLICQKCKQTEEYICQDSQAIPDQICHFLPGFSHQIFDIVRRQQTNKAYDRHEKCGFGGVNFVHFMQQMMPIECKKTGTEKDPEGTNDFAHLKVPFEQNRVNVLSEVPAKEPGALDILKQWNCE